MDLTSGSYAILLLTALDLAFSTNHIHKWVLFLLWLHLCILSGVISPLLSSRILGTYWPGEFIFQCPIFLPFHCSCGSQGKNTGVGCHFLLQCIRVKSESEVAQSCLTRSEPMDCSPPGSSIHGIFQARELEWGAIAFSARTPWTVWKGKMIGYWKGNSPGR